MSDPKPPDAPPGWYLTLDENRNPVPCDRDGWAALTYEQRLVARTDVEGIKITTAFLGHDMDWWSGAPRPVELRPFGTLVSSGPYAGQRFCATWDAAQAGHMRLVGLVQALASGKHLTPFDAAKLLAGRTPTPHDHWIVGKAIASGLLPVERHEDVIVARADDVRALQALITFPGTSP